MDKYFDANATKYLILKIEELGKAYYCPSEEKHFLVDDKRGGVEKYKQIDRDY